MKAKRICTQARIVKRLAHANHGIEMESLPKNKRQIEEAMELCALRPPA
jgi:hypothetical protein